MIRSMTGFGKGKVDSPYGKVTVEVKTLNHRNLSVTCAPLNGFFLLEENITKLCNKKIFRGKVFVRVIKGAKEGSKGAHGIDVNEDVARAYLRKIKKVQKDLKLKGELQIHDILALPGFIEKRSGEEGEKLWPYIKKAAGEALDNLIGSRENEGKRLAKDFDKRLRSVSMSLKKIKKYEKDCVKEYRGKLMRSIREREENTEFDKGRLEAEVALYARNCDIAEEITRLEGHITEYRDVMKKGKNDVGKKLDFIAQEMQREANTIGAKSADFRISKAVISIKSDIEKLREQVKNIE